LQGGVGGRRHPTEEAASDVLYGLQGGVGGAQPPHPKGSLARSLLRRPPPRPLRRTTAPYSNPQHVPSHEVVQRHIYDSTPAGAAVDTAAADGHARYWLELRLRLLLLSAPSFCRTYARLQRVQGLQEPKIIESAAASSIVQPHICMYALTLQSSI